MITLTQCLEHGYVLNTKAVFSTDAAVKKVFTEANKHRVEDDEIVFVMTDTGLTRLLFMTTDLRKTEDCYKPSDDFREMSEGYFGTFFGVHLLTSSQYDLKGVFGRFFMIPRFALPKR